MDDALPERRNRLQEAERSQLKAARFRKLMWVTALAVGAVALIVGIGAWSQAPPSLCAVTGTVTIDGKPTEMVMVYFWPEGSQSRDSFLYRHASGKTDAQGRFVLKSGSGAAGIASGSYKVTFSRLAARGKPISGDKKATRTGAAETIPTRYCEPDQTPLVATVSSSAKDFSFEVPSK